MLTLDIDKRITIGGIRNHIWTQMNTNGLNNLYVIQDGRIQSIINTKTLSQLGGLKQVSGRNRNPESTNEPRPVPQQTPREDSEQAVRPTCSSEEEL